MQTAASSKDYLNFRQDDVDSAKLSLFSKLDTPVPNQNHGMRHFLYGLTDAEVQERRSRLLGVSKQQLIDAVHTHVLEPSKKNLSSKVIFGTSAVDQGLLQSNNWKVEKFSDGLSLRQKNFEGDYSEEEDGKEHPTM